MDKSDRALEKGDVVQLNPFTCENKAFGGCFMIVTDPAGYGAEGFIQDIGPHRNSLGSCAYYRAKFEEMEYIGHAAFESDVSDGELP